MVLFSGHFVFSGPPPGEVGGRRHARGERWRRRAKALRTGVMLFMTVLTNRCARCLPRDPNRGSVCS